MTLVNRKLKHFAWGEIHLPVHGHPMKGLFMWKWNKEHIPFKLQMGKNQSAFKCKMLIKASVTDFSFMVNEVVLLPTTRWNLATSVINNYTNYCRQIPGVRKRLNYYIFWNICKILWIFLTTGTNKQTRGKLTSAWWKIFNK